MATHGAALTAHRAQAVRQLAEATQDAFVQVAPSMLHLAMAYLPGGTAEDFDFLRQLRERRMQDTRSRSATFGPHRDEVLIDINGRSARVTASQGQHRLLTLSLKIAEMVCIARASGLCPLLLLDDVSSELDSTRTDAFFRLLGNRKDQVFLTTTRRDMVHVFEKAMGKARVFEVDAGSVSPGDLP
jgi:DNA replication and repair protein RecF